MNVSQNYDQALNIASTIEKDAADLRNAFSDMQSALSTLGNEDIWSGQAASEFKQSWDSQVEKFEGFASLLDSVKSKVTMAAETLKTFDTSASQGE